MQIYIHVPFCARKCAYCAFHSWEPSLEDPLLYTDALLQEITLWGERLGNIPVETVFFGGGTPSLLPARTVGLILDSLTHRFSLANNAEISFEANPDSAMEVFYLHELHKTGVNRLSLGIQSLNDSLLKTLGRSHSATQAIKTVQLARDAGFNNLNLDLMWGIPRQRSRQWLEDLKFVCMSLKPEHLSCYGLTLEPGTPLADLHERSGLHMPGDKQLSHMFVDATEFLEEQGYIHYEISNFSRMGLQCRHNLGYWEGRDYLGLGPSAVSTLAGRRWSNPASLAEYSQAARVGDIGRKGETLDQAAQMTEMLMLRLRTIKGLNLRDYQAFSGENLVSRHQRLMDLLYQKGLIRIRNNHLALTRNGMLVSNSILAKILSDQALSFPAAGNAPWKNVVVGEVACPAIDSNKT
jgi:oxygen-independent coproporphyrinogen-3 oxidase